MTNVNQNKNGTKWYKMVQNGIFDRETIESVENFKCHPGETNIKMKI